MNSKRFAAALFAILLLAALSQTALAGQTTATIVNSLPVFSSLIVVPDEDAVTAGIQVARPSSGNKSVNASFNLSDANGYWEINQSSGRCTLLSNSTNVIGEATISWSSCSLATCPGNCTVQVPYYLLIGNYTLNASANESYTNRSASQNTTIQVTGTSACGDGTCEGSETCASCQLDCGVCTASTPTPSPSPAATGGGSGVISGGRSGFTTSGTAIEGGQTAPAPSKVIVVVENNARSRLEVSRAMEGEVIYTKIEVGEKALPSVTSMQFYAKKPLAEEKLSVEVIYQNPPTTPTPEKTLLALVKLDFGSGDTSKLGAITFVLRIPKKYLLDRGIPFDSLGAKTFSNAKLQTKGPSRVSLDSGNLAPIQGFTGQNGALVPVSITSSGADSENYYYTVELKGFVSSVAITSTAVERNGKPVEETVREQRLFENNFTVDHVGEISIRKDYTLYTHKKDGKATGEDTIVLITLKSNSPISFTNIRVRELVPPAFLAYLPQVTFSEEPDVVEKQETIAWTLPKLGAYQEYTISYLVHQRVFTTDQVHPPLVTIEVAAPTKNSTETDKLLILGALLGGAILVAYAMQRSFAPEKLQAHLKHHHAKARPHR